MVIKNVQTLRAIAANGVLLSHLFLVEQKYGSPVLPEEIRFGAFGVDLFFIISGFIMVTVFRGISWQKFLFDRATRIYPPYWIYTSLVLTVALIAPGIVNTSFSHPPSLWRSYLLVPQDGEPLLAVGWTLVFEVGFYLCFALIIILKDKFRVGLWVWLILWAALVILFNIPFALEFIGGALIGCAVQAGWQRYGVLFLQAGCLWLLVVCMSNDVSLVNNTHLLRIFLIGIPCAMIVYGAISMELKSKIISQQWGVSLGNASYSIYLSHVLVISAIGHLYSLIQNHNLYMEGIFVMACIFTVNTFGLFSHKYIERPILSYVRNSSRWINFFATIGS